MALRSGLVWEIVRAGVRNRVRQVVLKVVKRSMDRSQDRTWPRKVRVAHSSMEFFTAGSAG